MEALEETSLRGAFIYVLVNVYLNISNTVFENSAAY